MNELITHSPDASGPLPKERNSNFENLLQRLKKKEISITPVFSKRLEEIEKKLQTYESGERDKLERYTTVFIYNYLLATATSSTKSFTPLFKKFDKIVSKKEILGKKNM